MLRTLRLLLVSSMAVSVVGCTVGVYQWVVSHNIDQARGTRSCTVTLIPIGVLLQRQVNDGKIYGIVFPLDHIYPGSTVYVSVDGQRFSGEEKVGKNAVEAMKNGAIVHISWRPLYPEGNGKGRLDLDGFLDAYNRCVEVVGGEPD